ncbi:MAG: monovalent cation/H(+) antiporter subunit G [Defluviitaleaceae bacterium]|nr:monovalent cation/H(+) antiporter subunit G [Defluviitaleaceae bacterium]
MDAREIVSSIVIGMGVAMMLFGVIGIFRFKDFYQRLLVAAKVDTVSMITLFLGLSIRHGFSFFSAKLILIIIIVLILNPMVGHVMVHSAYKSGYRLSGQLEPENEDETNIVR